MHVVRHLRHLAIVPIAVLIFSACRKEDARQPSATTTTTTANHAGQVSTPFGWVEPSRVHLIAKGYHLSLLSGRIQKLENKTGKMIEDFGVVKPAATATATATATAAAASTLVNGWIAWAGWLNANSTSPITYFTASWTVPDTPSVWARQNVFLFNALENESAFDILQPVLGYGYSAAGGGDYWGLSDWYVDTYGDIFCTEVQPVSPGTNLQGVIELENSNPNGTYSYYVYFSGYSDYLEVDGVPLPNEAFLTLESNGVSNTDSMYPPDAKVPLTYINLQQDNINPAGRWFTGQGAPGSAQKAVVVNGSTLKGEVDIYFR